MKKVILVSGSGGAGKETTGKILLDKLHNSAWIDIKALVKINPWEYNEEMRSLGTKNAASLINNFINEGYEYVILSGGVSTQKSLDELEALLLGEVDVRFLWLDADKQVRDERRISRARDDGDKPEFLDKIDSVYFDPGELKMTKGKYYRIDTSQKTPQEVVEEILKIINE